MTQKNVLQPHWKVVKKREKNSCTIYEVRFQTVSRDIATFC